MAPEDTDPEHAEPMTACQKKLTRLDVEFATTTATLEHPDDHPELDCTVEDALLLAPVIHGVAFRPTDLEQEPTELYVSCGLAQALEQTAALLAQRDVTDVVHFGTYGCKTIAGGAQLSEHAVGRAADLAVFRNSSGDVFSVLDDWRMDLAEQDEPGHRFLQTFVQSLYDADVFHIILTPNYNADHYNHFHLDLTPDAKFMQ
jgi:hypothetical protein